MKSKIAAAPLAATSIAFAIAFGGAAISGCRSGESDLAPAAAREVAAPELERFEFSTEKMATSFRLVCYAKSREQAVAAALAAFARVDEIEQELSDWRETSEVAELRRACATAPAGPLPVGADLVKVLDVAQRISAASEGAFDVTVGPLVELWRRARRREELPGEAEIAAARAHVGYRQVELDSAQRTVTFKTAGIRLDFGAIAKGFAADEMVKVAAAHGVSIALAAAGGDIAAGDPPPGAEGWRIALAELGGESNDSSEKIPDESFDETAAAPAPRPASLLVLSHAAVSTSGDEWRSFEVAGVRYSHIVDPRTGMGLTRRVLTTVVAPDGATADALATATNVVGPDRGLALVARFAGSEARIVTLENGTPIACASPGFARMMRAASSTETGDERP
jgi:thiamine biosynthesis lipoprotein